MNDDDLPPPHPTLKLPDDEDVVAADGSRVRILATGDKGSMAHFTLMHGEVSRAVVHSTVEEIWYVIAGRGRMWREKDGVSSTVDLRRGVSVTISVGVRFQFRNDGRTPLVAVAVAMPPWPGDGEVREVDGVWAANV